MNSKPPRPSGLHERPSFFLDTTPEALHAYYGVIWRMTPEERLSVGLRLGRRMRALSEAAVRMRLPDYNDKQVRLAVIRLRLGRELFERAYPGIEIKP